MVRIRLSRFGAKKQPCYRIVVADQRTPRGGNFIDEIGKSMAKSIFMVRMAALISFWEYSSDATSRILAFLTFPPQETKHNIVRKHIMIQTVFFKFFIQIILS